MNTETSRAELRTLDAWPLANILAAIVQSNEAAVRAVAAALPELERAAAGLEGRLAAGGRLVYVGAGTSGRLGLQDAAELPPTFGFDRTLVLLAGGEAASAAAKEGAEDDEDDARARVNEAHIGARDAVVGLAASGRTPFTVAAVRRARERGAFTVGVANNPGAPLLEAAEVGVLLATPPEVVAGSTRLAAGTAQKVALNALSTSVLVRAGGAYGNLMVGMRPVNEKLKKRAVAIVLEATGASEAEAKEALAHASIREAIVMLLRGVPLGEARARLARHQNRVRDALGDA